MSAAPGIMVIPLAIRAARAVADGPPPGPLVSVSRIDGMIAATHHGIWDAFSVPVPAGRHTVELKYDPPEFRKGAWASVAGVVLLLVSLAAGFFIVPRRLAGRAKETPPQEAPATGKAKKAAGRR